MTTRNGEEKLRVFRPVDYRCKIAPDDRTYQQADTSTQYDRTVSKNITEFAKDMTAQMELPTSTHWIR